MFGLQLGRLGTTGSRQWSESALWPQGASSPGLWIDGPSYPAACFQDSAGTTALSAVGTVLDSSNPVGLVLDRKAGATSKTDPGLHLSQSTSAARPVASAQVNRLKHTEDFYGWVPVEITVVNAAATAPNRTMTCSFLRDSASFSVHGVAFDLGTTPKDAPVYASAYFAKFGLPNSKRYAYMSMVIGENITTDYRYAVNLDLQTGTVTEAKTGAQVSGGVTTIVSDGSFWHVTLRAVPLTERYTFMIVGNSDSATPVWNTYWDIEYAGDGVSGSYVWGTQWANAILPYQRVTDASNYDTTGFPQYLKFDGVDDELSSATFAAGTLTSSMDCLIAVRRDSAADTVCGLYDPSNTNRWFAACTAGSSERCVALQPVVGNPTVWVDGTQLTGGTDVTRGTLHTALTAGNWHILELRGLDLSTWTAAGVGGYTSYVLNGALGGIELFASGQDANRDKARARMAGYFGVTLP